MPKTKTSATGKRSQHPEPEEASLPVDMVYIGNSNGLSDDATVRALAKKLQAKVESEPNMDPDTVKAAQCVADSVLGEAADGGQKDQEKWLAGLATSRAGQKLMSHLSHTEAAPHMRNSSGFEEASAFRRILIHALSKKPNPFGLPKKLPKYVAIVNFSGERLLMYSNNACLVAFLTMGADGLHPSAAGVQKILDHAVATPSCSVLLSYSLPFQQGVDSAFWEVRTLVRSHADAAPTGVDDSYLVCTNWDKTATKGTATQVAESQRVDILDRQMDAFALDLRACDLDMGIQPIEGVCPSRVFDEKDGKLMKMISVLKNERRKLQEDHRQEIDDIKKKYEMDLQKTNMVVGESFKKQASESDSMQDRVTQAENEVRMLRTVLKDTENAFQKYKSDEMLAQETIKGEKGLINKKVAEMQSQNDRLSNSLKAKDKERDQALSKQAQAHRSIHETTERRLQATKSEIAESKQAAEESELRAKKIEAAFEAVCGEKTLLVAQLADTRKEMRSIKTRSSIACGRASHLNDRILTARMAHVKAEEQVASLKKKLSGYAAIEEAAGAAANESDALQKERDALADKIKTLEAELQSAVPKPPVMQDADTMTVPVMSEAEFEVGELKSEIAAINGTLDEKQKEIDQLKLDVARARARSGKKPPPTDCLPDSIDSPEMVNGTSTGAGTVMGVPAASHGNGGGRLPQTQVNIMVPGTNGSSAHSTIDLGHDLNGDHVLESAISQLQHQMRTVADMARTGKLHERNAQALHAKVQAYETMSGFQGYYGPQQHGWFAPHGYHQ